MYKIYKHKRPVLCEGFTLIEIILYCAIFITFAVVAIESIIWFNNRLTIQANLAHGVDDNIYRLYFATTYKRYKINNPKIEAGFPELISSTTQLLPLLKEDRDLGITFDQTSVQEGKNEDKVNFIDSVGF